VDVASCAARQILQVEMSDRASWLEEWCPTCRAAPGIRCRSSWYSKTRQPTRLHVSRGWRVRRCPTCRAYAGEPCATPSGREASAPHSARLRPGAASCCSPTPCSRSSIGWMLSARSYRSAAGSAARAREARSGRCVVGRRRSDRRPRSAPRKSAVSRSDLDDRGGVDAWVFVFR